MANGDITAIKQLGSFTIPGGGNTLTGVSKNNKVMVWGEITATYVSTGIKFPLRSFCAKSPKTSPSATPKSLLPSQRALPTGPGSCSPPQ